MGDAAHGRQLFLENCMHCHGVNAEGAAIGANEWAPSLAQASLTQIAEAVRLGPQQMPRFNAAQLSQSDLNDVVTYLSQQQHDAENIRVPAHSSGPVLEGLIGWIAAGICVVVVYAFTSKRSKKQS